MKRSRVYLMRHGQVTGYENFPVYGHTDVDLTETGVLQMQRLAERLRLLGINAIYSSDLKRSVESARQIALYHDVPIYSLPETLAKKLPSQSRGASAAPASTSDVCRKS